MLEGCHADATRSRASDDAYRYREVFAGDAVEALELGMAAQRVANLLRRIGPLHSRVQSLGVLPEHDNIDLRLLKAALRFLPNKVQRIAGEGEAGPHADVEIEDLPHGDDGAEVLIPL